jgi:hypothetical protein
VQPSYPLSDERQGIAVWLYAEAVLDADFHRLGGARWRRREAPVRRRCSSMRSIVLGSVMNATILIVSPHRPRALRRAQGRL